MTLPAESECNGHTDVRDAPWLYRYVAHGHPNPVPTPTLHLAHAALRRRRLLRRWVAKHGERAVWQFLRHREALER